jgi:hypothetical protein
MWIYAITAITAMPKGFPNNGAVVGVGDSRMT